MKFYSRSAGLLNSMLSRIDPCPLRGNMGSIRLPGSRFEAVPEGYLGEIDAAAVVAISKWVLQYFPKELPPVELLLSGMDVPNTLADLTTLSIYCLRIEQVHYYRRPALWGSQYWLPPPFRRRLSALGSAPAGKIARPTSSRSAVYANPENALKVGSNLYSKREWS
jgi:hypothetical protein